MGKTKAKSVPASIWDQHKQQLHNLYITKGNTVGRIQDKMAKKGFHASKHQYRDKFKIWKFRKNCARLRPAIAVPVAEHGANSVLGVGPSTTPHTEVTVEPFVDITSDSTSTREIAVGESTSPFLELAPEILHNENIGLGIEQNIPVIGVLPFELAHDPQPASVRNLSLVETSFLQPDIENFGYFDLGPYDNNEGACDDVGDWEAGTFELALFDRYDTSGSELNYLRSSRRPFL